MSKRTPWSSAEADAASDWTLPNAFVICALESGWP